MYAITFSKVLALPGTNELTSLVLARVRELDLVPTLRRHMLANCRSRRLLHSKKENPSALHLAVEKRDAELVKQLLEVGHPVDVYRSVDEAFLTPLQLAVKNLQYKAYVDGSEPIISSFCYVVLASPRCTFLGLGHRVSMLIHSLCARFTFNTDRVVDGCGCQPV
jgi:hypothetical protein